MKITAQQLVELKEKRVGVIKQMRDLNEKAKTEKRNFTAEENASFDKMSADERDLKNQIDTALRDNLLSGFDEEKPAAPQEEGRSATQSKEERAFSDYLRSGEKRDLTVTSNGGALAPQQFVAQLIAEVAKATPLLSLVNTLHVVGADSIGAPNQDADASDPTWTDEVPDDIAADSTWKIDSKRELKPYALAKMIRVSDRLIKTSALPVDSLVRAKLSEKISSAFENGIVKGTGTSQPLGIFTASAKGIATSRDVVGSNTTTAIKADSFIQTKMKVREQYRKNAVWVMSNEILTDAMLLKDNNGQYIWRPGIEPDSPDMILGRRVIESEFAPSTKAAGAYAAVFGDMSYYWWVLLDQIEVQVLKELYATKNLIGYKSLAYADGAPIMPAAFARMAFAAS